jgi:diamine N-acetyltransferase
MRFTSPENDLGSILLDRAGRRSVVIDEAEIERRKAAWAALSYLWLDTVLTDEWIPRPEPSSVKDEETIQGKRVVLRPASTEDESQILGWLLRSDITSSILGPPLFPERPVPRLDDPSQRLDPHYLDGTEPELGRCFLILVDGEPVGLVTYNDIVERDGRRQVELDIWMRSEAFCGKGYGTDALEALCGYLHEGFGVEQFMVQPSARSPRAIRAYEKLGFRRLELSIEAARELWGPNDYLDSV